MRNDAKLGCEGCDAAIVGDRMEHPNMVQGYVFDNYITARVVGVNIFVVCLDIAGNLHM